MRIGIDARTILSPEKSSAIGAGHYTYQLVRYILNLDEKNEYVLFFDHRAREKDIRKFKRKNIRIVFFPFSDYKQYLPGVYKEILETTILNREKLDILHVTSPESRIPVSYQGKIIVTFSDFSVFKTPDCFSSFRRKTLQFLYKYMAHKARGIIATSLSVKNDVVKFLKKPVQDVSVVYNGLDERFFKETNIKKERVLGKYGVKKKYILFVGTIEPNKNISRLLQSFAYFKRRYIKEKKIKNKNNFEYQMVLVGKNECLSGEYLQTAKDLGISKDVVFAGYVIGEELSVLFRNAEFFILPSLYEGFGISVLEAFASQTPAIVSDIDALREIADQGALFVNPKNAEEISDAMWRLYDDENLKDELSQKGFLRARDFKWEDTARKTIELYESLG